MAEIVESAVKLASPENIAEPTLPPDTPLIPNK
jgi:hypothetical protein